MIAQRFLHPRHVVPCAELVAAVGEPAHRGIAQMGVEGHTVAAQVGVVVVGIGDAGVETLHVLGLGDVLQLSVQPLAQALAPHVLPQIDAGLHRLAVGGPFAERAGIGVPQNFAVFHGHDIGIAPQGVGDAALKFLQRGDLVLKGDGGSFYIGHIDGQQRRRIVHSSGTDGDGIHENYAFFRFFGRGVIGSRVAMTCAVSAVSSISRM